MPADKACTNVFVVCKHYYKQILTKELNASSTYLRRKECVEDSSSRLVIHNIANIFTDCPQTLIEAHDSYMLKHNIVVSQDNLKLPIFYWLPKLHIKIHTVIGL